MRLSEPVIKTFTMRCRNSRCKQVYVTPHDTKKWFRCPSCGWVVWKPFSRRLCDNAGPIIGLFVVVAIAALIVWALLNPSK